MHIHWETEYIALCYTGTNNMPVGEVKKYFEYCDVISSRLGNYFATQDQQEKWNLSSTRNWFEIYPQLSIFFSEIMSKYTK